MNDLMQDDDNIEEGLKMADKTDWIVEGFQFGTEQDANLAKNEKLRVERLEERLDYQSLEMVYAVYKKAVENRVFKTPVGYEFLKKLQRILKENQDFEHEVEEIPIQGVYSLRESANPTVERIKASQKKPKPAKKNRRTQSFHVYQCCINAANRTNVLYLDDVHQSYGAQL